MVSEVAGCKGGYAKIRIEVVQRFAAGRVARVGILPVLS
jgi:hypothetical protein